MWRLCSRIYFIGNSFWKFYEVRSERGDFNSCGKWSSRVLPLMLWWSLAWFPYFYSDCSWPYCDQKQKCDFRKDFTPCCKLTPSHSIVLKNGCVMISMNPDSLLHPRRSAGFLLRNPLRMEAALTLNDLGMRMVFSKITWNKVNLLWEGHKIWKKTPPTLFWCYWVQKCHNQVFLRRP